MIDPLPPVPTDVAELGADERHRLLSNDRRRVALDALADRETPTGVEEVAAAVARRTGDDRRGILIALHHVHLPALADAGVLDYDAEAGRVDPGRAPNARADAD